MGQDVHDQRASRRRLLRTASVGAVALAGCLGDEPTPVGTDSGGDGTTAGDGTEASTDGRTRTLTAPDEWQQVTGVEDVVAAYPSRIDTLLEALDTERDDMDAVSSAMDDSDTVGACEALLTQHRESDQIGWLRNPAVESVSDRTIQRAADIVENDVYAGFAVTAELPRQENGHLDWEYLPPSGDNQFVGALNRHGSMTTLMRAYLGTGEERYLERLDRDLRDWVIAADSPPLAAPFGNGSLEPALRMPKWARIFYGLQDEEGFQPATRLLMLASITAHGRYLVDNPGAAGFTDATAYGALTCGVCWAEFADAGQWRTTAGETLERHANRTVYADGVAKEPAAHYHWVALSRYDRVVTLLRSSGRPVPPEFEETTRSMWTYLAWAIRPDGTRPLNGDSDRHSSRDRILRAAAAWDAPTWRYIATNGTEGKRPEGPPSRYFPDAGQLVSRSGWGTEAHWSFFDIGPRGGHAHDDWGHLSVTAYGRDLLTDTGRFTYSGDLADRFRPSYVPHTRGHNTVLIDGSGQAAGSSARDTSYAVKPAFDFAVDRYEAGYEGGIDATHGRATVYLRGVGWIVADHVTAIEERTIQPLWHLHPDCTTETAGSDIVTTDPGAGNVRVTPAGDQEWSLSVVEGEDGESPQGWYSETYGEAEPAPAAVYETTAPGAPFGWVISVAEDAPDQPAVEWMDAPAGVARLRVGWPNEPTRVVTILVDDSQRPYSLPDGRRLDARLLIEGGGETHVANGELQDADGGEIVSDQNGD